METDQHLNQKFYDELSDDYHLLFADWDEAMQQQARTLDQLIRNLIKAKQVHCWIVPAGSAPRPLAWQS
ncbi:MAG: hypothetical protein JNM21_11085 [Taibaiella sp.]|nr:hypothetical protein [Taibaiella sp.]